MSAIRGARERARIEVTAAIKVEARRQLAAEGAAKLSLRAVARELGMVSSALYRYFPSRDELLTALIVDAYDSVGEVAENAHRTAAPHGSAPAAHLARWVAVACAVRGWALAHPHEYALIYGSPVPGYSAPQATIAPASRVGLVLIAVVEDAHREVGLALPPLTEELRPEAERLAADLAPGLPPPSPRRSSPPGRSCSGWCRSRSSASSTGWSRPGRPSSARPSRSWAARSACWARRRAARWTQRAQCAGAAGRGAER